MENNNNEEMILYFKQKIDELREKTENLKPEVEYTDLKQFHMLVGAVYSYMKGNDFFELVLKDPRGVEANNEMVENNLRENFGIVNEETAQMQIGMTAFRGCQWQFVQFDMMEHGTFDQEFASISPKGKEAFMKCKSFSDELKGAFGDKGYLAWDVALGVDLIKESLFSDYLNEPSSVTMLTDITNPLFPAFDNWVDFAVSFLAGAVYSTYKNSSYDVLKAKENFDFLYEIVEKLFTDESVNVWGRFSWYKPKEYFKNLDFENLRPLVKSEQGCFVSDRISVDGAIPCFAYREEPFNNFPDSGWRFFAGDESKEYSADINRSNIFKLNVIANYDESILPLLDAEVNTAFIRKEGEDFIEFKTVSDAMKNRETPK